MTRVAAWISLVVVIVAAATMAVILERPREEAAPAAGVPQSLAEDRARRVHDISYDVDFDVPPDKTAAIHGHLSASFRLDAPRAALAFDFAQSPNHVLSVHANGAAVSPTIKNGHIVIPARSLKTGWNAISVDFVAGDESLNRNDDLMYTLFVPARASFAMPCFDQPNLKARWQLTLEVPAAWAAVSNGAETLRSTAGDRATVRFAQTEPLPTYLFAFATGKFQIDTAERKGRVFRMFHRETDAAKVARNRDAIFDLHAAALDWLERYTGIPYPWGKFDFVLIPSFQFGGMEHAGAIYYNASSLMLDETATANQRLGRANVISHETSHMWFGDLVTMTWFNDVWMKEVFANFMAAKIVNPSFPDVNHPLRFLLQNYPVAYDVDRTDGANPIRQDLSNLNDAGSLYGAIIYQKAPIVMRQLELIVGEEHFRDGLRLYLAKYAMGNATWPDLIAMFNQAASTDLSAWSHAWVDEPGRPAIRTELVLDGAKIRRLAFQEDDPRGRGLVWPERLQIALGYPGSVKTIDLTLSGPRTVAAAAAGLPKPLWILPVAGGLGYGDFELDADTLAYLTHSLADITDPLMRGAAWIVVWEAMLDGRVPASRVRDELVAALPRETDELNIQQMLSDLRTIFWRFTPAAARVSLAPRIEETLRTGLGTAKSAGLKSAWFNGLKSIALTPGTVDWLEHVWRRDVAIPGLTLAEPDEADLALELALRDVRDADAVLDTQAARFKNADRRARFAFVAPAVSHDATVRDRLFERLKDVTQRQHEAWVLEAESYLNHPLRADSSQKYVRPALDLIREIQQTGDIFFPKRWADATLGGYQSHQVAAEVHAFLDALPADYPPRLRWVVLASADPLFRAARIVR